MLVQSLLLLVISIVGHIHIESIVGHTSSPFWLAMLMFLLMLAPVSLLNLLQLINIQPINQQTCCPASKVVHSTSYTQTKAYINQLIHVDTSCLPFLFGKVMPTQRLKETCGITACGRSHAMREDDPHGPVELGVEGRTLVKCCMVKSRWHEPGRGWRGRISFP